MKKLTLNLASLASLATLLASCGQSGTQGQLVGDYSNKMNYKAPTPSGMAFVPTGVLRSGYSDEDIENALDAPIRDYEVGGFYMDATEITNAEYRQFTNWVKDSIAHTTLGDFKDDPNTGAQSVDWSKRVNYKDEDVQSQLAGVLYIPANLTADGVTKIDPKKLVYNYTIYDYDANLADPNRPASDFVIKKSISVYPDTTVWAKMFNYSDNDPISQQYNWYQAFDEYPVVGVNWNQANAFCTWRTSLWRDERQAHKMFFEGQFKLPTEQQWEWAARGGRDLSPYPWGGPYIINKKGCYLANFKPTRGDYAADGGLYTTRADAYWANDYGLFNMAGNVAEWTSSSYVLNANDPNVLSDINPDVKIKLKETDPAWLKRKVVKGGSWRDPSHYLQVSVRDYEFADTAKAYIGFRTIYSRVSEVVSNSPKWGRR